MLTWIRQPNGDRRSADDTYMIKWKWHSVTRKRWYVVHRGRAIAGKLFIQLRDAQLFAQSHAEENES